MAKAASFVSDVESLVVGKGPWMERLPPDARVELDEVRKRFKSGQYTALPYQLATAIISSGASRGWNLPSEKVLVGWLKS